MRYRRRFIAADVSDFLARRGLCSIIARDGRASATRRVGSQTTPRSAPLVTHTRGHEARRQNCMGAALLAPAGTIPPSYLSNCCRCHARGGARPLTGVRLFSAQRFWNVAVSAGRQLSRVFLLSLRAGLSAFSFDPALTWCGVANLSGGEQRTVCSLAAGHLVPLACSSAKVDI